MVDALLNIGALHRGAGPIEFARRRAERALVTSFLALEALQSH